LVARASAGEFREAAWRFRGKWLGNRAVQSYTCAKRSKSFIPEANPIGKPGTASESDIPPPAMTHNLAARSAILCRAMAGRARFAAFPEVVEDCPPGIGPNLSAFFEISWGSLSDFEAAVTNPSGPLAV
jgi:hypothetical protein